MSSFLSYCKGLFSPIISICRLGSGDQPDACVKCLFLKVFLAVSFPWTVAADPGAAHLPLTIPFTILVKVSISLEPWLCIGQLCQPCSDTSSLPSFLFWVPFHSTKHFPFSYPALRWNNMNQRNNSQGTDLHYSLCFICSNTWRITFQLNVIKNISL